MPKMKRKSKRRFVHLQPPYCSNKAYTNTNPIIFINVFMSIGLEIGGLEIQFDEVVVGLVGEMFKSKTITLKDLTDMFNVIVHDNNIDVDVVCVHKHIVQNLNKCKKKIMRGGIAQSLTLSGNVAVLQEAGAEERLRKNNALNTKIGVLTRELFEICQTPIFTEEDACGTDEEVAGGVDEAPEVGGDEEAEVGRDCGFEQQGDGNAVDDPLGAYTKVRGEDKIAYEDKIVSRSHDKIVCIEIHDDGDEDERVAIPLVILPLRSLLRIQAALLM
ncbi:hypothetical protein LR48_Vigan10g216200 [Vigna angularis]|uniref:Uncharacterized protein n=1 Tax=Phaseolus angularis TaxID=3914 RepID=A0A0L9VMI7_PHAAN|nr:hypothetical protein LR48_Vigan10g216200 [Vigna angularis]